MNEKIPILYQVVAHKETQLMVPIKNKFGDIVKEVKRHVWKTTLIGEYTNRMVADYIAEKTQLRDKGKRSVNGGFPAPDVSKDIIRTTQRVHNHIMENEKDWFSKYREPREAIECAD